MGALSWEIVPSHEPAGKEPARAQLGGAQLGKRGLRDHGLLQWGRGSWCKGSTVLCSVSCTMCSGSGSVSKCVARPSTLKRAFRLRRWVRLPAPPAAALSPPRPSCPNSICSTRTRSTWSSATTQPPLRHGSAGPAPRAARRLPPQCSVGGAIWRCADGHATVLAARLTPVSVARTMRASPTPVRAGHGI